VNSSVAIPGIVHSATSKSAGAGGSAPGRDRCRCGTNIHGHTGFNAAPAEKASAEAALAQAQWILDKTFVRAWVTGRVEQFACAPAMSSIH